MEVTAVSDRSERLVEAALSRAALAAAAVADLGVRYGDEVLALGSLGAGRVLPAVTAWAVFVVGYLRFSPRIYPTLGPPSEEPGFRSVVAAVALGGPTSTLAAVGGGLVVAGLVLGAAQYVEE